MSARFSPINKRSRRQRYELSSEINVTPLVDVMLVLLVIFMVTSPMLVAGVHIDLPQISAAPISSQEEPLSVTVTAEGIVMLQETEVTLVELIARLQAITAEKQDIRILLRGDRNVNYGAVMHVLGTINNAGFQKIALITDTASGNK